MISLWSKKYICPETKFQRKKAQVNAEFTHLTNWAPFTAIFPRRIIENDVAHLAIGKMWRCGSYVYSYTSETFGAVYKWKWVYATNSATAIDDPFHRTPNQLDRQHAAFWKECGLPGTRRSYSE